jgi:hypothetical protein
MDGIQMILFEKERVTYNDLQKRLFGSVEAISATDWHRVCDSLANKDLKTLELLSAIKLRLLGYFYNLQKEVRPALFRKLEGRWIFLVECNFNEHIQSFSCENDAFDAGCEKRLLPPVVFTVRVSSETI